MPRLTRTSRWYALALLCAACPACVADKVAQPDQLRDPVLAEIVTAFERRVQQVQADQSINWHAGWAGNIARVLGGEQAAGLCTEWQELAYLAVRDTVAEHRWGVAMVRINRGPLEHNAVAVFDAAKLTRDDLYHADADDPAWVLDGWARGRADVFTLPNWIATQGLRLRGLEVFDPEAELSLRRSKGIPPVVITGPAAPPRDPAPVTKPQPTPDPTEPTPILQAETEFDRPSLFRSTDE